MPENSKKIRYGKVDATLTSRTGEVIDIDTELRTNVSSQYSTLTETERVSTSHRKKQNVFVRRDDGKEQNLVLSGANLPIRKGTRLGYVELDLGNAKKRDHEIAATANLDTGDSYLNMGNAPSFFEEWKLHIGGNLGFFIIIAILLAIFTEPGYSQYVIALAIQVVLYRFTGYQQVRDGFRLAREVHQEGSKMIQDLIHREPA